MNVRDKLVRSQKFWYYYFLSVSTDARDDDKGVQPKAAQD